MTQPLTAQQERLWNYVKGCKRSPSYREMVDALGLKSTSNIARLVDGLERKGFISTVGQTRGGYRMKRAIVANDGPRPELSGYTTEELAHEIASRLEAA